MRNELVPVVPFSRPDSQGRILVPESLRPCGELIVVKLVLSQSAMRFMGLVDPSSEFGEKCLSNLGGLLYCPKIDNKGRIIISKMIGHDPELDFMRANEDNKPPLGVSLLPREGGAFVGPQEHIASLSIESGLSTRLF